MDNSRVAAKSLEILDRDGWNQGYLTLAPYARDASAGAIPGTVALRRRCR